MDANFNWPSLGMVNIRHSDTRAGGPGLVYLYMHDFNPQGGTIVGEVDAGLWRAFMAQLFNEHVCKLVADGMLRGVEVPK